MSKGTSIAAVLAAAILATGVSSAAGSDVLYWMVDGSESVSMGDGTTKTVSEFFSFYAQDPAHQGTSYAARIRVTGGSITDADDVFLQLYVPGEGTFDGDYGVEFSDGGGYWGAGVPDGNQSPSGDYSAGSPEYSFTIELGNIDASDNWTTVATSAAATYSSLAEYIHQTFDYNPPSVGEGIWTVTSFTYAPEPTSGLLTALGLALLALRRKRFDEGA